MATRKQRSTTKAEIIDTDIERVVKYGKDQYRNITNEFYVFEAYEGSGYYFAESEKLNDNFKQHWIFNYDNNRWEIV